MTGYADLVARAQPRLLDFQYDGTEGRDWSFAVGPFTDGAGTVIDLSSVTFVSKVLTGIDGTEVATWTVTGGSDGYVNGVLADSSTTDLATTTKPRQCVWYCKGTLSGAVVQFWGPTASNFRIYPE